MNENVSFSANIAGSAADVLEMYVDDNGRSCEEGSKSVYNVSGEGVGVSLLRCKSGVVGDAIER